MKNLECQKHLFNLPDNIHYLNCAYKAPLLKSSEEACIYALKRERNPINIKPIDFFTDTKEVKKLFASIINANPSEIAIVPSVSYGLGSVLFNTKAKQNGNAITVLDEFPSCYFSLKKWCSDNSNTLTIVKPNNENLIGNSWNQKLLQQITKDTSIVLISSVHWMNGIKFNLKAIGNKCREVGATFIVDGTQSVGALPIDIAEFNIDALVCASYKWLFGPYSLALAYLSKEYANGIPLEQTWINRTNALDFNNLTNYNDTFKPDSGRYNMGETSNFILMPMLKNALKQIIDWNPKHIQQYCKNLIKPLVNYISQLNIQFEHEEFFCNHLFSLKLPDSINSEKLKSNLQKANIHLSVRGENLRVSVNVFNDAKDIEKLIHAIEKTLKEANNGI